MHKSFSINTENCGCQLFRHWTFLFSSFWIQFPAYNWVLAKRLLSGWLVGWLVSRVCRASCVCPRAAEGRQARVCVPCVSTVQERRDSAECIIQQRFAIRVDSVPSCKLGSARQAPTSQDSFLGRIAESISDSAYCNRCFRVVRLCVCLSVRPRVICHTHATY